MVPCQVALDRRLSAEHLRIYVVMASSVYEGAVSKIGQRLIGRLVGLSAMTVGRRIAELVSFGHIRAAKCKNGARGWYELTSEVFGQKQGKVDVVRHGPAGKRLVSVEDRSAASA